MQDTCCCNVLHNTGGSGQCNKTGKNTKKYKDWMERDEIITVITIVIIYTKTKNQQTFGNNKKGQYYKANAQKSVAPLNISHNKVKKIVDNKIPKQQQPNRKISRT